METTESPKLKTIWPDADHVRQLVTERQFALQERKVEERPIGAAQYEDLFRYRCGVEADVAHPCFLCETTTGLLYRYERTKGRGLVMACQTCLMRVLPKPTLPFALTPLKYRVLVGRPDLNDWWEENVAEAESFTREPIDFVFPLSEAHSATWNFGWKNTMLERRGF